MLTFEQLKNEGWVQQGRSFGADYQFCILVKNTSVLVFNRQFDSYVIGEFEVPLKLKKEEKILGSKTENLPSQDYHNDNPV